MAKIKVIKQNTVAGDNFLLFKITDFLDVEGKNRTWSYAERPNKRKAVVVVPLSSKRDFVLLIRQFRVPMNQYVIEFPAGLMEENEAIEECSIRELEEETGFNGKILQISPLLCTSAGLTSETIYLVLVEIHEAAGCQNLEASEEIEVLKIPIKDAQQKLLQYSKAGDMIDSKVWTFLGLCSLTATCQD